jgi:phosphoribosylanthranilate isomerase
VAVFVKICGITSEEDALLAVAMGADAIGFLLAPSKRQITATRARDIAARLPPEVLTVGVFRNELKERVVEFTHAAGLKAVQLLGYETAAESSWVS